MLSAHLKEMELDQLIIRSQYDAEASTCGVRLSEKGKSLLPILTDLQDWGMNNLKNVVTMKEMIDSTLMKAS